ncbi:thioredoxin [Latilactobacillus curvatus]|uniref:thioredoxin n=1 Tax=Latilactobacillus curvatus TaxID=28038 RepID=UPI0021A392C3|nr:thioredoxin [Latilactobacillus curvatus]MCT3527330.1 thioredoxin [Latilactobacillus curvatus]MDG2987479.1 thioredoxin [Latilactobacillus curvatus]
MATQILTEANFKDEVQEGVTLVDFWATWCPPCRMQGPIVEELADDYGGKAKIAKVDVDHNQNLAAEFGIQSIPTLLVMKDGQLVQQMVGLQRKETLAQEINTALA